MAAGSRVGRLDRAAIAGMLVREITNFSSYWRSTTSSAGGPDATALPWDMISTVSASRCASSM